MFTIFERYGSIETYSPYSRDDVKYLPFATLRRYFLVLSINISLLEGRGRTLVVARGKYLRAPSLKGLYLSNGLYLSDMVNMGKSRRYLGLHGLIWIDGPDDRATRENNMTLAQAKAKLKAVGLTIRKRDGEYRVNYIGGSEVTAYYTDDLQDAYDTAMRFRKGFSGSGEIT